MVMFATVFFVIGDWLTAVSNYPFSLSWSEGNRFWDYSIMYGMDRYINPVEKTVVHFWKPVDNFYGRFHLSYQLLVFGNAAMECHHLGGSLVVTGGRQSFVEYLSGGNGSGR